MATVDPEIGKKDGIIWMDCNLCIDRSEGKTEHILLTYDAI